MIDDLNGRERLTKREKEDETKKMLTIDTFDSGREPEASTQHRSKE